MSSSAMHVAKTGLNAQQSRIQVISNNLANVNTTGFKRDRANFESLLYQVWRPAGAQTSEATSLTSPSAIAVVAISMAAKVIVRFIFNSPVRSASARRAENHADVIEPRGFRPAARGIQARAAARHCRASSQR